MIYSFDTDDKAMADASLLVYSIYRSKSDRFNITTDLWNQVARFTHSAGTASKSVVEFIERFSKKMKADNIKKITDDNQSLTAIINNMNDKEVLNKLINEHIFVILMVRTRIDAEKSTIPDKKFNDDMPFGAKQ